MIRENFFSIILPTYNRAHKISKALNSVINQSYQNWELIIVDNYSIDNTEELINLYNNKKFSLYKINNNGVIAKSRNLGIEKSKGDYLCFLDSDDWWEPKKLELVNKSINDGYEFIYHDHNIVKTKGLIKKREFVSQKLTKPIFNDLILKGPSFATSSVSLSKKHFNEIGKFDESFNLIAWEDWDAWLRYSKKNEKFFHLNYVLSNITQDDENYLNKDRQIKNLKCFKEKYMSGKIKYPNWYNYTLFVNYSKIRNFRDAKILLSNINFFKLNFIQKIIIILYSFKIYLNL